MYIEQTNKNNIDYTNKHSQIYTYRHKNKTQVDVLAFLLGSFKDMNFDEI